MVAFGAPARAPMTQRELVLQALRSAGERGVCLADVPLDLGYTLRNRVASLRHEYTIESERCRVHAHDGPVSRYWLKEKAASPVAGRAASIERRAVAHNSTAQLALL